jgi:hypothetical protein
MGKAGRRFIVAKRDTGARREAMHGLRTSMRVLTAIVLLAAWPVFVGSPVTLAQLGGGPGILDFEEMEALVTQVDYTYREVSLWDYQSDTRRSGLQVEGSVDLGQLKVGDYVLARVGVENDLVTDIRVIPPPKGDERFEEALQSVLGKEQK